MPFFIIFVLIPLIEIGLFMTVGDAIGLLPTLLLAFVTAIIGGWIVKYQGFELFQNTRNSMASGKFPAYEIFEGFCLVAAGATLITPGFFTDTIGFLLLVPSVRKMAYGYLKDKTVFQTATSQRPQPANDRVIEGEFETINNEKD
jgi:UPF0716 protein FxsA